MKIFKKLMIVFSFLTCMLWVQPAYSLTDVSVLTTNSSVGAQGDVIVSFTVDGSWPSNGSFTLTFPSGFSLALVGAADVCPELGLSGDFLSAAVAGQSVSAQRDGTGSDISGTAVKVKIKNVVNPNQSGLTGTFLLTVGSEVETIDGVIISDPLVLGSGSNHSKYCVIDDLKKTPLPPVLALLFMIVAFGIKTEQRA